MNSKYVKITLGDIMQKKITFKEGLIYAIIVTIALMFLQVLCYSLAFTLTKNEATGSIIGYTIDILIIFFIYKKDLIKDAKNIKQATKNNIKHLLLAYIILTILVYIVNLILYNITNDLSANENLIRESLNNNFVLRSLSICLLTPIAEELTFRYPFKFAKRNNTLKFITYTLIFALMHVVVSTSLLDLLYIIPYIFLSMSIGYSFYKTNNIYTSMFFHIINNTTAIITLFLIGG